jgi:aryl-alcohol dehydrogenase-like predicted oxidoreductase
VIAQDLLGCAVLPRLPVLRRQHAYDPGDGLGHQIDRGNARARSPDLPADSRSHMEEVPSDEWNRTAAGQVGRERARARGWHQPVEYRRAGPGSPERDVGGGGRCGMGFFDTAEIYTFGRSERALGAAARQAGRPVVVASKFAPMPTRITAAQFRSALDRTLKRLGRESVDLYYLHFPYGPRGVSTWMKAMAAAVKPGKIRAAGISNCNVAQMRKAADVLGRYGIPLAANQVHYSLAHREPETNGVLDACRQMDVALVAYRPLASGALSAGSGKRQGPTALAGSLREVATARDATALQVALAWLLKRDEHVIAIPGATKPDHVRQNSRALTLELSNEEFAAIDRASTPTRTRYHPPSRQGEPAKHFDWEEPQN